MSEPAPGRDRDALVDALRAAAGPGVPPRIAATIHRMHPAEVAGLVEALPEERRGCVWDAIEPQARGELLVELRGEVRQQLIDQASAAELLAAVAPLQLDELADLQEQLPDETLAAVIAGMNPAARQRFELIRRYAGDCAGGLMDIDALAVGLELRLGEVQDYLRDVRARRGALPEHLDSVFAVDDGQRYAGFLALSDVVSLPPDVKVREAIGGLQEAISADTPASEVARRFEDRDLLSAPVVDPDGRLLGRITIDDVVDVIRGQGENAVLGMAGLDPDMDLFGRPFSAARRRSVWLAVHLVNALVAAAVISLFRDSIEQLVALAVLMPIVAGMGGVGGSQSLALVTRGLALHEIGPASAPRLLANEVSIALVNGLFWSALVGALVYAWFDDLALAGVFALALGCNLLNGAFNGTWLPLLLSRLGIDPAIAGGVLLFAATDILGFLIFLGLGTLLLL